MRKFLLALILSFTCVGTANATKTTISSGVVNYANLSGIGTNKTIILTATNNSTSVTTTTALPASLTGSGGWLINISGVDYEVSNQTSTTSLVLKSAFNGTTGSYNATLYPVVFLRITVDRPFTPNGETYVVQPGGTGDNQGFYKNIGCSYKNNQIITPSFQVDSMVDAPLGPDRLAKFAAFFFRPEGGLIKPYSGFTSFQVPNQTTPMSWSDLSLYNNPGLSYNYNPEAYSKAQIDFITNALDARVAQLEGFQVNPEDYGVKGDLKEINGAIGSSGTTFTSTTAIFQPQDVGKTIVIKGAGAPVVTSGLNGLLVTTITGYTSSTTVTVASPASVAVSNAYTVFYTDDTAAFTAALAALSASGGGKLPLKTKKYGISQVTIPNNTIIDGTGYKTTQFYSPFGQSQTAAPDGIFRIINPPNASTDANIEIRNIQINALNIYQYQAGIYDLGSTYVRIRKIWIRYSHWGTIQDQEELSSVEDSIFEAYDEGRDFGLSYSSLYRGGLDPESLGFTKAGTANGTLEPMVFPDDCWQCGRWQVVGSGTDTPNWSKAISTNQFSAKGFFLKTKVPEVVTMSGGKAATTWLDDGVHRFEINWQAESTSMNFKINGGATVYTIGLSDELGIQVAQGGATATVVKTGTYFDTVVATVNSISSTGTATVGFGDIDATSGYNSNTYWQAMEWFTSWPVAAGSYLPPGDEAYQSRFTKTITWTAGNSKSGGSVHSSDNQVICPGCYLAVTDVGKTITIVDPANRAHSVSGTVSSYYGDGYVWLMADINASVTSIPVSADPRVGGRPVWLYFDGEAAYCTGYSAGNLTGCTRGMRGSTAKSHAYVDGHTVSLNVYRTWVISTTSSYTIDGGDITYNPAGGPEFVNVIQFNRNQYNGTAIQIDDRGGYTHKYFQNNHNGGAIAMWITSHEVTVENEDFEGQAMYPIRIGGSGPHSVTLSGSPFSLKFFGNSIGSPTVGSPVRIDSGSSIDFDSNSLSIGFGFAIANNSNGSVGSINLRNNTTQGGRVLQTTTGYIIGSQLGARIPLQTNGALSITDNRNLGIRPSTGPLEMVWTYSGNEEEPRGALGTITAGSANLAITAKNSQTQFYSTDVGKTIKVEYAGTPDAGSSVLVAKILTYVDPTHVILDTAATTTVTLVNAVWYKLGPVTPAITFYDAWNAGGTNSVSFNGSSPARTDPTAPTSSLVPANRYFRFQGLTAYTSNRTVNLLDASGTLGVTSSILTQNAWLTVDGSNRITGDPTFASLDVTTGFGMVRYLNIKASTSSGTQAILDISNSGGTAKWSVFYDNTGDWFTLQSDFNNRQMLTAIPNATYDYLQLHVNEGINWNGYSISSYSSSAGIARFANNVVEINRGLKTANGGALGDLFARRLRLQGSGASTSVYNEFLGAPTGINQITIPDFAGNATQLVASNGALTAGRVPYNAAIGSGVGLVDDASLTYSLGGSNSTLQILASVGSPTLSVASTGTNDLYVFRAYTSTSTEIGRLLVSSGSSKLDLHSLKSSSVMRFLTNSGDIQFLTDNGASYSFYINTNKQVSIGSNSITAQFDVNVGSASRVGQIIKTFTAQTADALQIQDSAAATFLSFNINSSTNKNQLTIKANSSNVVTDKLFQITRNSDGVAKVWFGTDNNGAILNFEDISNIPALRLSNGSIALASVLYMGWTSAAANIALDTAFYRNAARKVEINNGTAGQYGDLLVRQHYIDATMTAGGTVGAQTINKSAGSVNFAATATSLVVTNSLVTVNSILVCTVQTNDSALKSVQCVAGAGSFTMYGNAAANAETKVSFIVINQ